MANEQYKKYIYVLEIQNQNMWVVYTSELFVSS